MESILHDLKISLRMLWKRPGFPIASALVLAFGIGAIVSIFSFLSSFVLHPLDLPDAGRIMQLWEADQRAGWDKREVSAGNFLDWKTQNRAFLRLAAYRPGSFNLASRSEPERVSGAQVSAEFFRVLGAKPILGRDFLPNEDQAGAARVAAISSGLWRRHFGSDPAAIGRSYIVNGESCTIVAVLPADFHLPHLGRADIWVPFLLSAKDANNRGDRWLDVLGRLKPGVTAAKAQAEMSVLADRLTREHPRPDTRIGVLVVPLEQEVGQLYRASLLALLAASAALLLLACANVANLQLARNSTREQEISIRVSLGVSRLRLVRQLFLESLLVALLGAALALVFARGAIALMLLKLPAEILGYVPHYGAVPIDSGVLLFSLAAAVLTAAIFGLLPAVRATRPQISTLLKGAGRSSSGRRARLRRGLLLISEVTLALTLLIIAALMLKSFGRLQQVDPGFKAGRVLTMQLDLAEAVYPRPEQLTHFYESALERIAHIPGVLSAAVIDHVPMGGSNYSGSVAVFGATEKGDWSVAMMRSASSRYFETLGIPVLEGRPFGREDTATSHPVVLVNQTMAKHFWPTGSALGKRLKLGGLDSKEPWLDIVGVVGDVKHWGLADLPSSQIYQPLAQWPQRSATFVLRTAVDRPASMAQAVRKEVLAVDPNQPLGALQTMQQLVDHSTLVQSMSGLLLGFFGTIALLVGASGVFSVIYYLTSQRTHEFGIRMALGASRNDILQLVLGQGLRWVGIGLLIGMGLAFGSAQAMSGLLYGVAAGDPVTYGGAALLLGAIATLAIYLPARQVSRGTPAISTQSE
jgi:putative ABC transport system permease protein